MSAEAKLIDLVDYLSALGRGPPKVRDSDYWYLSHLRTEKTPCLILRNLIIKYCTKPTSYA